MAISPCFDQKFFPDLAENTFVLHTSALKSATCPFLSEIHPHTRRHTHTHTHTPSSQIHALYCQSPGGLCSGGFSLSPLYLLCSVCSLPHQDFLCGRKVYVPDSKCIREILPPRLGPGTATPDLHLYGMENRESKRGKIVPALRESDRFFFISACLLVTTLKLTKMHDCSKVTGMTWNTCCISYCILLAMFLICKSFCINLSAKWMQTIQPFAVFFCWRTMDITECLIYFI